MVVSRRRLRIRGGPTVAAQADVVVGDGWRSWRWVWKREATRPFGHVPGRSPALCQRRARKACRSGSLSQTSGRNRPRRRPARTTTSSRPGCSAAASSSRDLRSSHHNTSTRSVLHSPPEPAVPSRQVDRFATGRPRWAGPRCWSPATPVGRLRLRNTGSGRSAGAPLSGGSVQRPLAGCLGGLPLAWVRHRRWFGSP